MAAARIPSLRSRVLLLFSFSVVLAVPVAAAAPSVDPGFFPVSQLPSLARQYAPGVSVPAKIPAGITQFVGGPGGVGHGPGHLLFTGAPRPGFGAEFFGNDTNSLFGFALDVFSGKRVNTLTTGTSAYLAKGGWSVTTAPFTAGRYRGLVQSQRNGANLNEMYVWAFGKNTYVVRTTLRYAGLARPLNTWSKRAIIASFRIP